MKLKHGLICLLLFSNASYAHPLTDKVNEYFQAQKAVEHKNSTETDVAKLLSLLTMDATFEHPSFDAVQSKSEYEKGLLYYLGKYGKCDIKVLNIIEGLNAVTVEYLPPCIDQDGKAELEGNRQKLVTLFEFEDEK
ncbi:nuclear transport factor 2 family protein [Thalassotalea maritima]|uniref:nuclear transport factor 2 family protein n=1 Tax=Thalassotalea maritima TaxID=3242416 RepID=UPI003527AC6F